MKRPIAYIGIVLGLLLAGFSLFGLFGAFGFLLLYNHQATGHVLAATIEKTDVGYRPALTYEYEVAGQRYTSQRYDVQQRTESEQWAKDVFQQFPIGSRVTVFYDSSDPQTGFLSKEISSDIWTLLLGSAFIGVLIVVGCVFLLKRPTIGKRTGKAGIGQYIQQGFLTANRSWPGIGFVTASWIVVIFIVFLAVGFTDQQRKFSPLLGQAQELAHPPTEAQDNAIFDWLKHAWPVALVCFLMVVTVGNWVLAGQTGYLAKHFSTRGARISEFWVAGTRACGALLVGWLVLLLGLTGVTILLFSVFNLMVSNFGFSRLLEPLSYPLAVLWMIGLIWYLVRLSFWYIAVIVDRLGPIAAMRASFRATRGRWWQVVGLGLLMLLIESGILLLLAVLGWLGSLGGELLTLVTGMTRGVVNLLAFVTQIYVGWATLAAYIRFYEETKAVPASSAPVAQ